MMHYLYKQDLLTTLPQDHLQLPHNLINPNNRRLHAESDDDTHANVQFLLMPNATLGFTE